MYKNEMQILLCIFNYLSYQKCKCRVKYVCGLETNTEWMNEWVNELIIIIIIIIIICKTIGGCNTEVTKTDHHKCKNC
jgi:hypothetical protein